MKTTVDAGAATGIIADRYTHESNADAVTHSARDEALNRLDNATTATRAVFHVVAGGLVPREEETA